MGALISQKLIERRRVLNIIVAEKDKLDPKLFRKICTSILSGRSAEALKKYEPETAGVNKCHAS